VCVCVSATSSVSLPQSFAQLFAFRFESTFLLMGPKKSPKGVLNKSSGSVHGVVDFFKKMLTVCHLCVVRRHATSHFVICKKFYVA